MPLPLRAKRFFIRAQLTYFVLENKSPKGAKGLGRHSVFSHVPVTGTDRCAARVGRGVVSRARPALSQLLLPSEVQEPGASPEEGQTDMKWHLYGKPASQAVTLPATPQFLP